MCGKINDKAEIQQNVIRILEAQSGDPDAIQALIFCFPCHGRGWLEPIPVVLGPGVGDNPNWSPTHRDRQPSRLKIQTKTSFYSFI